MGLKSLIFEGQVIHKRYHQKKHQFLYNVFNILIDIDDLENLDKQLNIFSVNKFNIFSFYEKDHGMKNNTPIKDWITNIISKIDIDIKTDNLKIYCLCYPRILGYVFNPITIWSIYDRNAIDGQQQLKSIQGYKNYWFAGAWTGNGFHEAGLLSSLMISKSLDGVIPWD